MSAFPDPRLLRLAAGWCALAALAVPWPLLAPAAAGTALALLGLLAADALLLARTPRPSLERRLPERLAEGREARIALRLHHPGERPCEAEVADAWPPDWGVSPVWPRAVVPAGGHAELEASARPARRGDRPLGPAAALVRSPLGLLRRRVTAPPERAAVAPDASRYLRPEALDPRAVLSVLGVKPSRRRGQGLEFESLRESVYGDDPRDVDWRATARRGRPVTRLRQHEQNQPIHIAVDASRLMGSLHDGRTKLDYAVDAALALVFAALCAGDRVGLSVFDRELRRLVSPRRHRSELGLFVEALRAVDVALVEADHRRWARELLARQGRRALVVVLTDFVEADPAALVPPLALLARRHRVLLVAVRDPGFAELDAPRPSPQGLHRRIVLDDLLREREETLARLRSRGLHVLDLEPRSLTAAVLNRYLALRYAAPT